MFIPLYDHNPLEHVDRPYGNYAIIALTCLAFAFTGVFGEEHLQRAAFSFGLIPSIVNDVKILPPNYAIMPEELSYLTYTFLHSGWLHLGGNMLFLWVFGDNVEDAVGHVKYITFYLLCAAAGGFAHTLFNPNSDIPLIGASGGVSGIIGAYLMLHPRVRVWVLVLGRVPLPLSAGLVLGFWLLYQFYNLAQSHFNDTTVSWHAHIGGVIAGALLIVLFRRRNVPLFDRNLQTRG